jgi:hypothetical protein
MHVRTALPKFNLLSVVTLGGATLLALAAADPPAYAQRVSFSYNTCEKGKPVTWKVPETGTYRIIAYGAQGGNDIFNGSVLGAGGLGAEIGGNFILTEGEVLQIVVGGAGSDSNDAGGGGGGGSFVVGPPPRQHAAG